MKRSSDVLKESSFDSEIVNKYFDAIRTKQNGKVIHLLNNHPFLINLHNQEGQTALQMAISSNNPSLVRLLLCRGARTDYLIDGHSIYDYAEMHGGKEMRDIITKNTTFHVYEVGCGNYDKSARLAKELKSRDISSSLSYSATEYLKIEENDAKTQGKAKRNAAEIEQLGYSCDRSVDAGELQNTGKPLEKADLILWQLPHSGFVANQDDERDVEMARRIASNQMSAFLTSCHDKTKRKESEDGQIVSGKVAVVVAIWPYRPRQAFKDVKEDRGIELKELAEQNGWVLKEVKHIQKYGGMKTVNKEWMDFPRGADLLIFEESPQFLADKERAKPLAIRVADLQAEIDKDNLQLEVVVSQIKNPIVIFPPEIPSVTSTRSAAPLPSQIQQPRTTPYLPQSSDLPKQQAKRLRGLGDSGSAVEETLAPKPQEPVSASLTGWRPQVTWQERKDPSPAPTPSIQATTTQLPRILHHQPQIPPTSVQANPSTIQQQTGGIQQTPSITDKSPDKANPFNFGKH